MSCRKIRQLRIHDAAHSALFDYKCPFASAHPACYAQFSITDNAVYSESVVICHSTFGAITLYAQVTNCTIANNLLAGDADYALDAQADPADAITGNRFLDNDVTHLTASVASIYLSANTSNNFIRTARVSVIDLGTGNQVVFH